MSDVPEEEVEAELQNSPLKMLFNNTMEDDDITIEDATVEITHHDDDDVNDETMTPKNISDPQDQVIQGITAE